MLKERRLWLVLALAAGDALAAAVALVGAYFARFEADVIPTPLGIPPIEPYLSLLVLLLPLHALSLRAVGLYEYRHERTKADEAFVVLQGATLATLLLVAATFFFRSFSYSRSFVVVFWVFDVLAVFGVRLVIRDIVRALRRHGRFVRRALVVGAGELGQEVVRRLRGHPEFGVRVVGYLDDRIPVGRAHRGQGGARGVRGGHARPRRLPGGPALPRPAARGPPRGPEGAERHRGRAGRRQDGAGRAPVRHAPGGRGGARGAAGHQPGAVPHHRLGARAQARHRSRAGRARPGPAGAAPGPDRAPDPNDVARPRALPPGAHGARRTLVRHPQVPHDARGHRGGDRAGLVVGAATAARPDSGGSCGASPSTSCRSSGTCSGAT